MYYEIYEHVVFMYVLKSSLQFSHAGSHTMTKEFLDIWIYAINIFYKNTILHY